MKRILDACCGSRMFWDDKQNSDVLFMDNRELETKLCDGRKLIIAPDIKEDFRDMPFEDESFYMVVFDPPHLKNVGENSWLCKKYGKLEKTWEEDLKKGFSECMRVLKPNGSLIFKWSEVQIPFKKVKELFPQKHLFHYKNNKTFFAVFIK